MADEQIVTNIVATSDFSSLIADVQRTTAALSKLQAQLDLSDKKLAVQAGQIQKAFGDTLRSTGQFTTHFVTVGSEIDNFGKKLDSGKLKLKDYFQTWQQHTKTSGGLIRDLAKQQVALQNAIVQPLGKAADGMMKFNVHVANGIDSVTNKTALARKELQIYNKVIQDGGVQLINWGKNTQWAGRQLTVGLTVPLTAFGVAAAKAFREADQELVRLQKVYGGLAATSAQELAKVRRDVSATAKELASSYGASYKETISLAADIAATGKQGQELIQSTKEATRLAILGEVDRQEAMKATLAIQSAFKQNTQELSDSINFLNAVENQTSTSLADLVEAIPKAGPVVKALGGSVQDLALYLTAMREGGINASEGANALKSALASIINPTKVAKEMFAGFGIDLGGIVTKNAGNLTGTILALQSALDQLDPLKKSQAIEQLFGKFQFARMNALFENLGKQGSQTLQVLDLMKASTADLANIASRELSMVTESASGQYKRAIESLRADLAGLGDQFLKIGTFFIKVVDGIVKFVNKMPDPIKNLLGLLGGITALAGPLIMLTGVFANFIGYVIKGIGHLRALGKGGEGFKLLTPEILAAEKAGGLVEKTFYSDAKAANILSVALANLTKEYEILAQKANAGAISAQPAISTMAGNVVIEGSSRVADPTSKYIGKPYSRQMSHTRPVAGMTTEEKSMQNIFGVVPGPGPVNQRIGKNPQIYMTGELPRISGLTEIGGVSTGIVAEEAAKWHSMTAAIAMQSQEEIKMLKSEIAATGTITTELSASYQALLPKMTNITTLAAEESRLIVADLQASKITVDQARIKVIELNTQIEAMMAQTASDIALSQGKTINVGMVPLTGQPVVDPITGKSNMKEMFHKSKTSQLVDRIARALGVRTSGGGYSVETTKPRRFATGGSVVPGTGNSDTVPALLTPGEFVVNKEATARNLSLLTEINGGMGTPGPNKETGGYEARTSGLNASEVGKIIPGFRGQSNFYTLKGTAGLYIGDITDPKILQKYPNLVKNGRISAKSINALMKVSSVPSRVLAAAIRASGSANRGSTEQFLRGIAANGIISNEEATKTSNMLYDRYLYNLEKYDLPVNDSNNGYWKLANKAISSQLSNNQEVKNLWRQFSQNVGAHTGDTTAKAGRSGASTSHIKQILTTTDGKKIDLGYLRGSKKSLFAHAASADPFIERLAKSGLGSFKYGSLKRGAPASGPLARLPRFNRGGMVGNLKIRGYEQGGKVSRLDPMMAGFGLQVLGSNIGGNIGTAAMLGGLAMQLSPLLGMMKGLSVSAISFTSILTKLRIVGVATFRALGGALKFLFANPVGLTITAITGLTMLFLKLKDNATKAGEVNRAVFGGTKKSLEEVGIKYKTVSERIKEANDQIELNRAKVKASYETYTKSGVRGLDLTLKQLKDGIAEAKKNDKESVGLFDKAKATQVNQLAASMKAQYVALGMTVQEATNQIYILIKASNKSSQALSAISSEQFKAISDRASAATYSVKMLANILADKKLFNAEEFARGLDNMLNSLDSYMSSLMETTKTQKGVSEAEALKKTLEEIKKIGGDRAKLDEKTLDALKQQDIRLGYILGKSETLASTFAKYRLLLSGAADELDIKALSPQAAVAAAEGFAKTREAAGTVLQKTALSEAARKAEESVKASTKILKNAEKADSSAIDKAIKNKQKLITKLEEERTARLKILDLQEKSASFETNIQQAQIRYQEALAAGDMAQAAQEQLNIKQLSGDRQRELARQAINDKADKERKKLESEITKLQEQKDALAAALTAAQKNFDKQQEKSLAYSSFLSEIKNSISLFGGDTKNDIEQFRTLLNQKRQENMGSLVNDLFTKFGVNQNAEGAYGELLKKLQTATTNELKTNPVYDKFSSSIEIFRQAVNKFAGIGEGTFSAPLDGGKAGDVLGVGATKERKSSYSLDWGPKYTPNSDREKVKRFAASKGYTKGTQFTLTNADGSVMQFRVIDDEGNIVLVKTTKPDGKADGGLIKGPGTGTSDSISAVVMPPRPGFAQGGMPIRVSDGEYIIKADTVNKYGVGFFDALNQQKFDKGGHVKKDGNFFSRFNPVNIFSSYLQGMMGMGASKVRPGASYKSNISQSEKDYMALQTAQMISGYTSAFNLKNKTSPEIFGSKKLGVSADILGVLPALGVIGKLGYGSKLGDMAALRYASGDVSSSTASKILSQQFHGGPTGIENFKKQDLRGWNFPGTYLTPNKFTAAQYGSVAQKNYGASGNNIGSIYNFFAKPNQKINVLNLAKKATDEQKLAAIEALSASGKALHGSAEMQSAVKNAIINSKTLDEVLYHARSYPAPSGIKDLQNLSAYRMSAKNRIFDALGITSPQTDLITNFNSFRTISNFKRRAATRNLSLLDDSMFGLGSNVGDDIGQSVITNLQKFGSKEFPITEANYPGANKSVKEYIDLFGILGVETGQQYARTNLRNWLMYSKMLAQGTKGSSPEELSAVGNIMLANFKNNKNQKIQDIARIILKEKKKVFDPNDYDEDFPMPAGFTGAATGGYIKMPKFNMGGMPKYNISNSVPSVAAKPFNSYAGGGSAVYNNAFTINPAPGMDEKMLANYVVSFIEANNYNKYTTQGKPGARLI